MPTNPNVRFGRALKPVSILDTTKAGVQRLFHKNSQDARSANIPVGAEPVVLVAFGLREGEKVEVFNVFENFETSYVMGGEVAELSLTNTIQILPIGGVYCLRFTGSVLGELLVIAYRASAMDPEALKSIDITNPDGPQKNLPNLFLNGEYGITQTHEFVVGSVPLVFRAFGLGDTILQLYAVFDDEETQVTEDGPVTMSVSNSTLVITITGRYKFRVLGESADVILAMNPTALNYYSTGITATPDEGAPAGVTYIGTGAGIIGGPIIHTGNIALSGEVWDILDNALQVGDPISLLENDVGYIADGDVIDGGNF